MAEGLEPSISGLTIRRLTNLATPQKFGGPEGIQTLTRSLQDFYALCYITSPIWWLRVELNHQPSDYETLALSPLSYAAVK